MIIHKDAITGLVLAGGRGTRMGGVDKGLQMHLGVPLAQYALERLRQLILASLEPPRPRKATRPTKASKERRLVGKALQQRRKVLRGRVRGDD